MPDCSRSVDEADVKKARLLACRNILVGDTWRLGMSEFEIRGILEEGRALAQQLGRPAAIASMLVGVAAHLGVLGRAEAALEIVTEATAMISGDMSPSEVVAPDPADRLAGEIGC